MNFFTIIKKAKLLLPILLLFISSNILAQLTGQVPFPGKNIPKYVDPLPNFAGAHVTGTNITVQAKEFQQKVLSTGFVYPTFYSAGTYVWGYEVDGNGPHYPGWTVEATRGVPTTITYVNALPNSPFLYNYLYIDQTLHWANPNGLAMNDPLRMFRYAGAPPIVTHMHGAEVMSEYDGGPDQWYTTDGTQGPGYRTYSATTSNSAVYYYPNDQEAATLWFHDHTLGATRINVYAGLAAFYFLRDPSSLDTGIPAAGGLPAGNYEIELAIQDRMFDTNGQLYFPNLGINPADHPFWIPEFFGDAIVVNGKTWPFFNVEPRRYRFRVLNGSNARFYSLTLGNKAPSIWVIGTDGGLLDTPVQIAFPQELLIAPGERFDIIIDFTGFANQTFTLTNNAKAPYPNGATPDPQTVGQIMQFRVASTLVGTDNSYNPASLGALRVTPIVNLRTATPDVKRRLTLKEIMGAGGPLEVLVNNSKWNGKRPGTNLNDSPVPITGWIPDGQGNYLSEHPQVGATETWEIVNLTADAHPIHLHLVQFQLINRQQFQLNKYLKAYNALFPGGTYNGVTYVPGTFIPAYGPPLDYFTADATGFIGGNPDVTPYLQGKVNLPFPEEMGWKDTYKMYPGEVTKVMVRFAPQDNAAGSTTAGTNYFTFDPTTGPGYVWHCHIIDHEDNEMMRPYNLTYSLPKIAAKTQNRNIPTSFELKQNYPNPFNPSTVINFSVPEENTHVSLKIFNSLGAEIGTLINQVVPAGYHQVNFNATGLSSGIYFYTLTAGNFVDTKKMVVIK